jgi:hypothetical protein
MKYLKWEEQNVKTHLDKTWKDGEEKKRKKIAVRGGKSLY